MVTGESDAPLSSDTLAIEGVRAGCACTLPPAKKRADCANKLTSFDFQTLILRES